MSKPKLYRFELVDELGVIRSEITVLADDRSACAHSFDLLRKRAGLVRIIVQSGGAVVLTRKRTVRRKSVVQWRR